MVVVFESTFLNTANFHYFVGGFAVEIQAEYLFFGFGQRFKSDLEHFVVVGRNFVFTRISKSVDAGLFLFERIALLVASRAKSFGFFVAQSVLLGKEGKKVVDFGELLFCRFVLLILYLFQPFKQGS